MCAGAIHTPHLLNLSGIGAAQQLREHDVPVAVDLPGVGQNLQVCRDWWCFGDTGAVACQQWPGFVLAL